jgi:tyrosyl-tRNA synthetase
MANTITDPKQIDTLLSRAVDTVYPTKEKMREALLAGAKLRIYTGIDPTSPDLHIGHTLWMWKLKEFQDMGHEVILLMGSFTAMIGDPTDKLATRKQLTKKEVIANTKNYQKAASKILRFTGKNAVKVMWNDKWLAKVKLGDLLPLMAHFTVQQMLERDMFDKRMTEGKPIGLHEFLYPLMQGYDSVAMDVDLEIGATDQTFNMLAGRTLQRVINNKEKFVLTTPLLTDANGKKIGKSEGNVIGILDEPSDLFGKIMALGDDAIFPCFEYATRVDMGRINTMKQVMKDGGNPRDAKMALAEELVRLYHGDKAAKEARAHFESVFQKHQMPEDMPLVHAGAAKMNILDLLILAKLAESKSDARRVVEQGGAKVDSVAVSGIEAMIDIPKEGLILQRGKRQFARVKP